MEGSDSILTESFMSGIMNMVLILIVLGVSIYLIISYMHMQENVRNILSQISPVASQAKTTSASSSA